MGIFSKPVPMQDQSRHVTLFIVLLLFVLGAILGYRFANGLTTGWMLWVVILVLCVALVLHEYARSVGIRKVWTLVGSRLPERFKNSAVRISWGKNYDLNLFSDDEQRKRALKVKVSSVAPVAIDLTEDSPVPASWEGSYQLGMSTMIFQRLGNQVGIQAVMLLTKFVVEGAYIIAVDSRCPGTIGDSWSSGGLSLEIFRVERMGPYMWFTGPWKPGYVIWFKVSRPEPSRSVSEDV